jgi:pimeloyl-ACP methyl ester carboxylesterase
MLGHGESLPRPPGTAKCVGSEADVLHQLVTKLRSGDYVAGADRPPQFDAVATVGHSMGSLVALVESYSYDDTGALVLTGAAHQITAARRTAVALGHAVPQIAQCPADEDGWFYQWPSPQAEASDIFYDPDPRVVDALKSAVEEESCTVQETTGFGLLWDQAFTPMVDVPVLVANGEHDFFFDPTATYLERYRYPSSPDVDTVVVPDAGHTYMIERPDTARAFRAVVGTWLTRRGF